MPSQPPLGPPYKVVVGIDYSDTSKRALHAALELAIRRADTQIYALAVAEGLLSRPEEVALEAQRQFRDEAQQTLDSYLAEQVDAFERDGARMNRKRIGAAVDFGVPGDRILAFAAELEADMIVLGTHGHTGIQRLMVGSVAENVLRHARCSVLVVRSKHQA